MTYLLVARVICIFSLAWSTPIVLGGFLDRTTISAANLGWFAASVAGTLVAMGWLG